MVSSHPRLLVLGALLFVVVPYVLSGFLLAGFFTVPFGSTLQSLGTVMLMLQSIVQPDRGFYRVLNIGIVAWVGTLSYSLYIWQQLFCSKPAWFGWDKSMVDDLARVVDGDSRGFVLVVLPA